MIPILIAMTIAVLLFGKVVHMCILPYFVDGGTIYEQFTIMGRKKATRYWGHTQTWWITLGVNLVATFNLLAMVIGYLVYLHLVFLNQ
jgi:hypothetical protein